MRYFSARYWPVPLLIAALAIAQPVLAAFTLSAKVDRDRVQLGETMNLTVIAEGNNVPGGNIDLSGIARDFDVTGPRTRSEHKIVNGKVSAKRSWVFELLPKRAGRLSIPPMQAGNQRTKAIAITVVAAAAARKAAKSSSRPTVYIEAETDVDSVPVRGQILYTMRIATAVQIRGNVNEPKFSDNTPVQKLSESNYRKTLDGRQYNMSEWRYAIFPQKSGQFTIPPAQLNAVGQRRRIKLNSESIRIEVLPIPAAQAAASWLPARELKLREEWDQALDQPVAVGAPLTREIRISAKGLLAEQLPALNMEDISGVKIYPEQANLKNHKNAEGVRGVRRETFVIIPTRVGILQLPEVRISWWNTGEGGLETAILPARSIEVVAGGESQLTLSGDTADSLATASGQVPVSALLAPNSTDSEPRLPGYSLILLLLGFAGWPALLWLWWRERRLRLRLFAAEEQPLQQAKDREKQALQQVVRACKANRAGKTQQALLQWAQLRWPSQPPRSLSELASRSGSTALSKGIDNLNRRIYRDSDKNWDGALLIEAVEALEKPSLQSKIAARRQQLGRLPDLYEPG